MKTLHIKYLLVLLLFLAMPILHAGNISLRHFNNQLHYSQGSGISLAFHPNDTFDINNQFILEVSGVNADWTNATELLSVSEFYVPAINAILPQNLIAGVYQLRIRSTLPADTLTTDNFNINSLAVTSNLRILSNLPNNTNFFNCLDCSSEQYIFGSQNQQEGAITSALNMAQRTLTICNYDVAAQYSIQLSDVLRDQKSPVDHSNGSFQIPDNLGIGTYVFTVEKTLQGISEVFSVVFVFHGNGTSLGNSSSEEICVGSSVGFNVDTSLSGIGRNYLGSKYVINFGDATPKLELTQAQLLNNSKIEHIYEVPSCTEFGSFFIVQSNLFSKGIQNNCTEFSKNGSGVTKRVNSSQPPKAVFKAPEAVCYGAATTILNTTIPGFYGSAGCRDESNFFWYYKRPGDTKFTYISNASWVDASHNLIIPASFLTREGCWEFKLEAQNRDLCQSLSEFVDTVMVERKTDAIFTATATMLCPNEIVSFVNSSPSLANSCSSPVFTWLVTPENNENLGGFIFENGTNVNSNDISVRFIKAGIYKVQLTVSNSCGESISAVQTIKVYGTPQITFQENEVTVCSAGQTGTIVDFGSETYRPNYSSTPFEITAYEWTVTGNDVQTNDYEFIENSSATSIFPVIRFKTLKNFSVKLAVQGYCGFSNSDEMQLSFRQQPAITEPILAQSICSGETTQSVNPLANVPEVSFRWFIDTPQGVATTASNGEGMSIPAAEFINSTDLVQEVVYTVIPFDGYCEGLPQLFSVKVNPTFEMAQSSDMIVCANENIAPVFFESTLAKGVSYKWYNSNPSIGLPESGTGNIPAFIAVNNQSVATTAIITVESFLNLNNIECIGNISTFEITVLPKVIVNEVNDIEVFNSQQIPEIKFNTGIADGNIRFFWKNSNTTIGLAKNGETSISTFSATNLSDSIAISYISVVAVYELNGAQCVSDSMKFQIRVKPTPVALLSGDASVCMGAQMPVITYKGINGIAPYTFTYRLSDGAVQTITTSNSADSVTFTAPTHTAGYFVYYFLSVTDSKNEFVNYQQDSVVVQVADNPLIKSQALPAQTVCVGGAVQALKIQFEGGAGNTQVRWYSNTTNSNNGGSLLTTVGSDVYVPQPFTQPGQYYFYAVVTSDESSCGMAISDVSQVTVLPDPVITSQPLINQVLCLNGEADTLRVIASGNGEMLSYQWYSNTTNDILGAVKIVNANSEFYVPKTADSQVLYYFCEINQPFAGCSVFSAFARVEVYKQPEISKQPWSHTICLNDNFPQLAVEYKFGAPKANYQWYENTVNNNFGGTIISGAVDSVLNVSFSGVGTRYYYCIVSFETKNCQQLVSETAAISVLQFPVVNNYSIETASGISFLVKPETNQNQIIPQGTTYSWQMPDISIQGSVSGASSGTDVAEEISQKLINLTNQTVQVRYVVTPQANGCFGQNFEIVVTLQPSINVNTVVTNISCNGANDGALIANIQGGIPFTTTKPYQIQWSGPDGFSANETTIRNLKPGTYFLKITDSVGLSFDAEYEIVEPQMLELIFVSLGNVICAGAANGFVEVSAKGGNGDYKFEWVNNQQIVSNDRILNNIGAGEYTVSLTDKNGCTSQSMTFIITEPEAIEISLLSKTHNTCFGNANGAIQVNVTGGMSGYRFQWSGANGFVSNEKNISGLKAGEYTLLVVDSAGCKATFATIVEQNAEIDVLVNSTSESCYGKNDGAVKLVVSGGVAPYEAVWSNLAEGLEQYNLSPGKYSVNITDAIGCSKTIEVEVSSNNSFNIEPEISHVTCFGANNGRIKLNLSSQLSNVKLKWSDGSKAGTERNNLTPGFYSVEIDNGSACVITETFVVNEPEQLMVSGTVTHAFSCNSTTGGSIDIVVTGGTAPYKFKWSNGSDVQNPMNLNAGTYFVTVEDGNGCTVNEEFKIIRPLPLKISLISKAIFMCETSTTKQLNIATASGGIPPYKLSWSVGEVSGQANDTMISERNMTVFVTVVDAAGCSKTEVFNNEVTEAGIEMAVIDCDHLVYGFNINLPESFLNNATFLWEFGDGAISEVKAPTHTYMQAGNYVVRLSLNNKDCNVVFETTHSVDSMPVLKLNRQPILCLNDSVELSVSGASKYIWDDGSTTSKRMIKREGNYSVTGLSAKGCSSVLHFTARYHNPVNYEIFSDRDVVTPNHSTVNFWTSETDSADYQWRFGADVPMRAGSAISHTFEIIHPIPIDIKLNVRNVFGCEETAAKRIWALTTELPNTFTPNGDGVNDVFLQGVDMEVYNSNGVLLYKGDEGWNGTFKGAKVAIDTYYYVLKFFTPDGMVSKPGYITLIR